MGKQLGICHKALEEACDILKEPAASIFRKCVNAEDRYTNDGSCTFPKMCETSLKTNTVLQLRKVYTVYKLLWKPQMS
jgi:hypothetical protein